MRVFQIGFNKCGTVSIKRAFTNAGVEAVHWNGGSLARSMFARHRAGKRLLPPGLRHVVAFTDMEHVSEGLFAYKLFKVLDKQYPNSKFILNTRDMDRWIESRKKHRRNQRRKPLRRIR